MAYIVLSGSSSLNADNSYYVYNTDTGIISCENCMVIKNQILACGDVLNYKVRKNVVCENNDFSYEGVCIRSDKLFFLHSDTYWYCWCNKVGIKVSTSSFRNINHIEYNGKLCRVIGRGKHFIVGLKSLYNTDRCEVFIDCDSAVSFMRRVL